MRLYKVEKLTIMYMFATFVVAIYILFKGFPVYHLLYARVIILGGILLLAYLHTKVEKRKITRLLRYLLVLSLLIYWYPETFEFNKYFSNKDHILAGLEFLIFRSQPAISFPQSFPSTSFAEWMNMAYFSFYIIIAGITLYFYFLDRRFFHSFIYTLLFSFFVYYLMFIVFPTAGPQYYFHIIGSINAQSGHFSEIGNYFYTNYFQLEENSYTGIFNLLVTFAQSLGERPTGAFPSSHVGITTVIILLIIRHRSYRMAFILSPLYVLLIMSTVYLQAHYVIDVFAGFISGVILYFLSMKVMLNGEEKSIYDRQQITPNTGLRKIFYGD